MVTMNEHLQFSLSEMDTHCNNAQWTIEITRQNICPNTKPSNHIRTNLNCSMNAVLVIGRVNGSASNMCGFRYATFP